jgi:hypothetical protein
MNGPILRSPEIFYGLAQRILIQQLRFSVFKGAQCTEEGREVHKLCLGLVLLVGWV